MASTARTDYKASSRLSIFTPVRRFAFRCAGSPNALLDLDTELESRLTVIRGWRNGNDGRDITDSFAFVRNVLTVDTGFGGQ